MRELPRAAGLALLGYGLAILLGLLAHESRLVGAASLLAGGALVAASWRRGGSSADAARPPVPRTASWVLAGLGALASVGTLAYNLARGSALAPPELALVAYGSLLLASLPFLGRAVGGRTVGTLVAWSLPVVLAPLVIYAANGVLTSEAGTATAAASPLVRAFLVLPTAALLEALGHDVEVMGNAMVLATPRGDLVLGVGLVCAGIYPAVLFAGLFGLYAWERRPSPRDAVAAAAVGLGGLWLLNLLRMVVLAKVGVARGAGALQATHDYLGWVLFAAFSFAYWSWLLRRRRAPRAAPGPAPAA